VFAVGGNAEAARRAGIKVDRVRIGVFALASALAGCGGILLASRLLAAVIIDALTSKRRQAVGR
jgi:D-xylose transport system permease protein